MRQRALVPLTGRCGAPARSRGARRLGACTRPHLFRRPLHAQAPQARGRLRRASHVSHEKWAHPPPWASSPGRLRASPASAGDGSDAWVVWRPLRSTLHAQASRTSFVGCSLIFYYSRFCIRLHFRARTVVNFSIGFIYCSLHEFWRWTSLLLLFFRRRAIGSGAGGKRLSGAVCGCRGKRRLGAHPTDTR